MSNSSSFRRSSSSFSSSTSSASNPHIDPQPSRRRPSIPLTRRRLNSAITWALLLALPTSCLLAANSVRNGKGNQIVEKDLYWGKGKEWDSINIELKRLSIDAPSRHYPRRDRRRSSDSSSSSSSSSSERASSRLNRLSHRPATIIEEPTLELDQVEWWGSSDIVGKSPFDHIPDDWSDRKRKSKVLFLTG
jgi:hypothetical protein